MVKNEQIFNIRFENLSFLHGCYTLPSVLKSQNRETRREWHREKKGVADTNQHTNATRPAPAGAKHSVGDARANASTWHSANARRLRAPQAGPAKARGAPVRSTRNSRPHNKRNSHGKEIFQGRKTKSRSLLRDFNRARSAYNPFSSVLFVLRSLVPY